MRRLTPRTAVTAASLAAVCALLGAAQTSTATTTLPTLTIAVNASSIAVGGTTQSGAVNVVTTATGVKEASAILVLLKPGVSPAELYALLSSKAGQDPNNASRLGSIVFDAETEGKSEAQTTLQPGQYVALAGQGEGPPKLHTSFTVTAAATPATLPSPEATVKTIEFGFRGPSVLHDGELVRFENEGFLVHMDVAFQVKNMQSARKAVKLLLAGKEKQAGKLGIGGASFAGPLSNGGAQQETITAKPGVYVQACFMDTQDGRNHTQLGMERIIKIVK